MQPTTEKFGVPIPVGQRELRANAGAQDAFVRSEAPYPALIMGQGGGKTVGGALKLILLHNRWPGVDSLVIEPTFGNLKQIAIPTLTEWFERAGIPTRMNFGDMIMYTPTLGSKLLLHSGSVAERITGFEVGRTWIDEPSRIPDYEVPQRNTWKNALARTRDARVPPEFRQVFLTGTHEGKGTWVWRDWESKDRKPGHVVFRGSTLENPNQIEYAAGLLAEYGDELGRQYIGGYAVEDASPAIPYDVLLELVSSAADREFNLAKLERMQGPLFVGMDIGRSKSLTVFWVVQDMGTILQTVGVLEMREAEFADQTDMIRAISRLPGFSRMSIDATYNPQTAEDAVKFAGESAVDAVVFTERVKVSLCQELIRRAQTRTIQIPAGDDILADWYSVKRVVSASGSVSYHAPYTADGHADRFFAAALACKAAATGVRASTDWTPGAVRRGRELRRM